MISVDTKKKELVGNYHNGGQQWRAAKQPGGSVTIPQYRSCPRRSYGITTLDATPVLLTWELTTIRGPLR